MTRPSTAAPILAALAVVLVTLLLGVYVTGYLSLGGSFDDFEPTVVRIRYYDQHWMVWAFAPAGYVESWLTGMEVRVIDNFVG